MRSNPDTVSGLRGVRRPMGKLGACVTSLALAVALAPGTYLASTSQAAHSSGATAVVAKKKKKCKRGFKLNKHGKCVSSSSPKY